ncbi:MULTISPECIES: TIGR01906 family membrane protein [unclassified Breznakia]|uniref:TIGR01906 family membrane protein n=1 Tax=unclassified Breznakia TaxID=2623764 RepID=UPI002405B092|nr:MULTISPECIES: TIGR01906 family membrane protein [unclassified Breznakia]MDF9838545.1 integral membrane protein (TIGR01906 family) [Breznakia sp. PFB2-8]MDF9860571.1 integral membrane protein (TIGR01906 family) [Breznakia sp. PH5-24]
MEYKLKVFFGSIICVLLIYVILFFSIEMNAFSKNFYKHTNSDLKISESINLSKTDYNKSIATLLDYLHGDRDDIGVEVIYKGDVQEAFNEKEATHMVDVRNLYLDARTICFASIMVIIILGVILYYDRKSEFLEVMSASFIRVSFIFVFLLAFLLLYACIDFTDFWTRFHKLFFTNDLWLLNPRTDLMIRLLPQDLFFSLVIRIVALFTGIYMIFLGFSIWYTKKRKKLFEVLFS